ncbi:hypothetical protein [Flavobacterium aestuarii]|uniref:hypothetical protein n=1 Tax=Flavobacterium aestuarii TaxID=3149227 RepID=UPI0032B5A8AD
MKKLCLLICIALLTFSCQAPQNKEEIKSDKGRYQMSVLQRADGEVCIFVLDTDTGSVTMRGDKSGAWTPQGSPADAIDKSL